MKDIFDWIPRLETEQLILRERTEDIAKRVVNEYDEAIQLQYFSAATKEALTIVQFAPV